MSQTEQMRQTVDPSRFLNDDKTTMVHTFVVSLSSNITSFVEAWSPFISREYIHHVRGVYAERRGLGCTLSLIKAFQLARDLTDANQSYLLFAEDHARPFKHINKTSFSVALHRMISNWHDNSPILFLGAHAINTKESPRLDTGLTAIRELAGTYGFLVHKKYLQNLIDILRFSIIQQKKATLSPDVVLSQSSVSDHDNVLATPLLIDHMMDTYSYTWKAKRMFELWNLEDKWWTVPKNVNKTTSFFHRIHSKLLDFPIFKKDDTLVDSYDKELLRKIGL